MTLEPGDAVRYRGLGAGRVEATSERDFLGSPRVFASVYFAHSDLRIQIPMGDPIVEAKLSRVVSSQAARKLLRGLPSRARVLPRTWDAREESGKKALGEGGPEEWADLLASYAWAEGAGVELVTSDHELVRETSTLLAAEISCATKTDFQQAKADVESAYRQVAEASAAEHKERPAEHFGAVVLPS